VVLAFAVARYWPHVLSNALEPGWVAAKMGCPGATGDLEQRTKNPILIAERLDRTEESTPSTTLLQARIVIGERL